MIVNKIIYQGGIILQHLTYYFKNRLYLHAVVHSSYRTNMNKTNTHTVQNTKKFTVSIEIQAAQLKIVANTYILLHIYWRTNYLCK